MAAQKGRDLLVRIGTTAADAATDTYTVIGGMRTNGLVRNKEVVDVSNKSSAGIREQLVGAGQKSMTISGSGVFTDSTTDTTISTAFDSDTAYNFQFEIPSFGTWTGKFDVTSLEYTGENLGAVEFNLTLESVGAVVFTAAP